jgi:DNA-directed RNA polymerase subunit omega
MKLIEGFDSNYRYILVAARRARQLQSGARPRVETKSRKPCRIAMDELSAGKLEWSIGQPEQPAAQPRVQPPPQQKSAVELASEQLDKAFGA